MKRSHALALSAMTLFLATSASVQAQMPRSGQQCQPAVANASMYGNCRLRIVQGQEVCRCAIRPQARRAVNQDVRAETTGSIGVPGASFLDRLFGSGTNSVAVGTSARSAAGSLRLLVPRRAGVRPPPAAPWQAQPGTRVPVVRPDDPPVEALPEPLQEMHRLALPLAGTLRVAVARPAATAAALEARAAAAAGRQVPAAMVLVPGRGMETVRGRATTTASATDRSLPTTPVPT